MLNAPSQNFEVLKYERERRTRPPRLKRIFQLCCNARRRVGVRSPLLLNQLVHFLLHGLSRLKAKKHVKPLIQGLPLPNAQNPYQDILRIAFFVVVDDVSLKLKK